MKCEQSIIHSWLRQSWIMNFGSTLYNYLFSEKDDKVVLMISQEGVEYIVCTLSHKTLFQQPLDLNFATGEELTFFINGKGKFWENPCVIQGKPMLYTGERSG